MIKQISLIAAVLLLSSSCKNNDVKYHVGQEWHYKTRPTEENSTLKILKIEEYPKPEK